jgi:hypothetical protein
VIFLVEFWSFWTEKFAIGIYRKTGPTKSTVLGPGPPPWEIHKIYWKMTFFIDFGAFNRAGKSVSKIGIYALPPQKVRIYSIFIKIYRLNCSGNNSRPITVLFSLYFGIGIVLLLFRFLVLSRIVYSSFSGLCFVSWLIVDYFAERHKSQHLFPPVQHKRSNMADGAA